MSSPEGQPQSGPQSSNTSPRQQQQQQQQPKTRPIPFANWPTLKILTPRPGAQTDEWCLTYCTQSVGGRHSQRPANCRSVCIRKVFPHEVRNIVKFRKHAEVDAEGKASYPLPAEGQPINLPRLLGGKTPEDPDDESFASSSKPKGSDVKHWQEGLYFWTTSSQKAALERIQMMSLDLQSEQQYRQRSEARRELWQDYQDKLHKAGESADREELARQHGGTYERSLWAPILSPEERVAQSLLVRIPPEWPSFTERIQKLLAPTKRALTITHDSIMAGEHKQFALRVWNKAHTNEPFILAQRTMSRAYERWKAKDETDEDDSKKGST